MVEAMPRMTIAEMGETLSIARYVGDWGHGGEMRAFMGDEPKEPSSPLERAAMLAFDVASQPQGGMESRGIDRAARNELVELMMAGLRIAIVDERENGTDGRSDVDRARLVLVSTAMVKAMRDRADGFEPEALENRVLESMRMKSGIEASAFSVADASAVGNGMGDMVVGEEARRQMREAVARAMTPSRDEALEDRLRMAEASWPAVRPREAVPAASVAKGAAEASPMPVARDRSAGR